MGKFYTGIEGSLSVDGVKVGKVRDWRFSGEAEALEVTTLGDYARSYTLGRQSHGGSCSLFWYANDQGTLEAKPLLGSILRTGRVDPDKKYRLRLTSSNLAYEFDAVITTVETGAQAGDVIQAGISFTVCGELLAVNLGGL